jgi:hypothetical protein
VSEYKVEIERVPDVLFGTTWLARIFYGSHITFALGFSQKSAIRAAKREIRKLEREKKWRAEVKTFYFKGENK